MAALAVSHSEKTMNPKKTFFCAIVLVAGFTVTDIAGAQSPAHHGSAKQQVSAGSQTAASRAFRTAGEKMHHNMAITYSGDTDVDFVRGMIPHHQGAIDMAKILLVQRIRRSANSLKRS